MTTFQKIRIKKCQMDKLTVDNRGSYNKEMVWYVTIKVLEIKKKTINKVKLPLSKVCSQLKYKRTWGVVG